MGNMNGPKNGGSFGGGAKPLSQEPTMNAHDWVWLGRSTLERSSGMLVPSIGNKLHHNNNNSINEQNMRIMTNPVYGVDSKNGSGNSGNQQQQQEACGRNPPPPINTSTYSVRDRLSNGNIVFNKLWKV